MTAAEMRKLLHKKNIVNGRAHEARKNNRRKRNAMAKVSRRRNRG